MIPAFDIHASSTLKDVILEEPFKIFSGVTLSNFWGGAFSYISPKVSLVNVKIGRYCSIGDNVSILSSHPVDRISTSPYLYQRLFSAPFINSQLAEFENIGKTIIGNDVWIGSGVKIKSGISIGDGAIIGAGSVVTKEVAPFSIVGGVPAKLIRMRFPELVIQKLTQLSWWNCNLADVKIPWNGDINGVVNSLEHLIVSGDLKPYRSDQFQIYKESADIKARKIAS